IPIELRPPEQPRVPRRQILLHPRRARLPEPRLPHVYMQESLLRVVPRPAAIQRPHLHPQRTQHRPRKRHVGRESLRVQRPARRYRTSARSLVCAFTTASVPSPMTKNRCNGAAHAPDVTSTTTTTPKNLTARTPPPAARARRRCARGASAPSPPAAARGRTS